MQTKGNPTMKTLALLGAALATLAATPAFSQQWYGGLSYGSVRTQVDSARINDDLTGNLGFFTASTSSDTRDSGYRVFLGRSLLSWLDVEGYYADLGETRFDSTVTPTGTLSVNIKSKAYGLAALAGLSPLEGLRLYGKLGVARGESKASPSSTGFVDTLGGVNVKRTGAVWGLGAQYAITRQVSIRAEYDVHRDLGDDRMGGRFDADTASLGLLVRF